MVVDLWFLQGSFAKSWCLEVVFCWCKCGGLVVKRGVLDACFQGAKNTPTFEDFFGKIFSWVGGSHTTVQSILN